MDPVTIGVVAAPTAAAAIAFGGWPEGWTLKRRRNNATARVRTHLPDLREAHLTPQERSENAYRRQMRDWHVMCQADLDAWKRRCVAVEEENRERAALAMARGVPGLYTQVEYPPPPPRVSPPRYDWIHA